MLDRKVSFGRRLDRRFAVARLSGCAMAVAVLCALPASASASTPGVSSNSIEIGEVTTLSGPAAPNFNGSLQGVEARFDLQNAEGGIDGRKIKLVTKDDQGNPTVARTAVQSLIGQNVFSMIEISDTVETGDQLLERAGVPVVGAETDGYDWSEKPYTNMVSVMGPETPNRSTYSYEDQVAKQLGVTRMGFLTGPDPTTIQPTEALAALAPSLGIKNVYLNDSIPFGTVSVQPTVLALKSAKVNGIYSAQLDTTDFAFMTGLKQAGVNLKAYVSSTAYTQDLLNDPTALASAQGMISAAFQVPVELDTPGTKQEQAAFAKYAHFTGVPNQNWTYGWVAADLTIKALQQAGKNVTRASFLKAIRSITSYNANGVLANNLNFSLSAFGKSPAKSCGYFVRVKGHGFVTLNGGKPYCGTLLK
jgi:branched-chain amino acid transport system substrate-binding protein